MNLCASAGPCAFASGSPTSPPWTSTPPVERLSKFVLFCSWNWKPSSGWYFEYPRTATTGMLYCIWIRSRTRTTCGCDGPVWTLLLWFAAAAANQRSNVHTGPSQPQVVRVRDRIQMQYNIPVVAVRGYSKYQPDDGFQFQLQNKTNFDKRST